MIWLRISFEIMQTKLAINTDIAIIGGGIAGLWLLNLLSQKGFRSVLCEATALGSNQTIASQGIIHGGVKYALGGALNDASEIIATMPNRWRACLKGEGEVDLRGTEILSQEIYLWTNGLGHNRSLGQLGGFLASKLLRSRIDHLKPPQYPPFFQHPDFSGHLYRLNELVLNAHSLLEGLAAPVGGQILAQSVGAENIELNTSGGIRRLCFDNFTLEAETYILAAGAGNEALLGTPGLHSSDTNALPRMQRRPLQQIMIKTNATPQHPVFAHYVDRLTNEGPRLTLTTHKNENSQLIWYVGGQLASEGAQLTARDLVSQTKKTLKQAMPWLDLSSAEYHLHRVDRAEASIDFSASVTRRPDDAWLSCHENILVCWPTKLTLAPRLGDLVGEHLSVMHRAGSILSPAPCSKSIRVQPTGYMQHNTNKVRLSIADLPWANLQ